jgi:hypothetical protein
MPERITKTEWARIYGYMLYHRTDHIDWHTGEVVATQLGEDAIREFDIEKPEDTDKVWDIAAELADNYNKRRV